MLRKPNGTLKLQTFQAIKLIKSLNGLDTS